MPTKFANMTGEEAEYDGGFWARTFFVAAIVSALGGIGCICANRIYDVGDKDTMTLIAIGSVCLGVCFLGIGLFISRNGINYQNIQENAVNDVKGYIENNFEIRQFAKSPNSNVSN